MSISWIRKSYGVPAKVGGRVEYWGDKERKLGTITGARNQYLLIRLDGEKSAMPFHPKWALIYVEEGK